MLQDGKVQNSCVVARARNVLINAGRLRVNDVVLGNIFSVRLLIQR